LRSTIKVGLSKFAKFYTVACTLLFWTGGRVAHPFDSAGATSKLRLGVAFSSTKPLTGKTILANYLYVAFVRTR
jgi:hypothetical protein